MPYGILDDYSLPTVPGTVTLAEKEKRPGQDLTGDLKKIGDIVLVPQPDDSKDDPLNWPAWRKNTIVVVLSVGSAVVAALGAMISPGLPLLAEEFDKSLDTIATFLVGLFIFWTGFFTFFTSAAASVWGKRVVLVLSTGALGLLNVWGFFTTTFEPFVVMRLLQGFCSAPLETLVTSTIQDIFYVHERGQKIAIWGLLISSGVLVGQIISGYIIQNLGVKYTFGITALVFIPLFIAIFAFVPETTYNRKAQSASVDLVVKDDSSSTEDLTGKDNSPSMILPSNDKPRASTASKLTVFRGRVSNKSFWREVIRPFPLLVYPAVIFSSLIYGVFFTLFVVLSILSVTILSSPPYNLTPAQIGLTNLPLLVTGMIGSAISGWMVDKVARTMARKNGGVYEPEFRLTLMAVAAVLSTIALFCFGYTAQIGAPLPLLLTFSSLHALASPFASQAAYTYVTDCHSTDVNQVFVTMGLIRGAMTFIASTSVNGLYQAWGPGKFFGVVAGINLIVCLFTIPMYIFGKRFRALIARKVDSKLSK
ncbi:hypothetical protein AAE478_009012 [Parahypoxylon ruwenzoriense]